MAEMERHPEDVNKCLAWMQHLARLMDALKLIVVCHLARLLPLLFKWAHAHDTETVVMVRKMNTFIFCGGNQSRIDRRGCCWAE